MDIPQILVIILLALVLLGGAVFAVTRTRHHDSGDTTTLERPTTPEPPTTDAPAPGAASAEDDPGDDDDPGAVATLPTPAQVPVSAPAVDVPESASSRMVRLRSRLARSGSLGTALLSVLSRDHLTESDWEELEETLLLADVGSGPTDELIGALRTQARVTGATDHATVKDQLRALLLELVDPTMDRSLAASPVLGDDGQPHPATILMVGVNGTGKTTTAGKLARILVAEDKDVVLGAADTFRAAAADQLQTWGDRVGVPVVRSDREGADPASVAFDAVKTGRDTGADVVIVDTAGRLQNKAGLMDELGKLKRVVGRGAPIAEVLLVLDATTGQNGMRQAQVFAEVADVSGIVLTKLDGTAKGGIVIAVQRELGMPVKFVGLGEGPDDLAPFSAEEFVDAILA